MRFEILRELGRGGMGAVYLARDRVLGREVAIKVIEGRATPEAVHRFILEARATAPFDHPALLPTYSLEADGVTLYFTMEALEGVTFAKLIRSGERPLRELVRLLAEAARGVAYAHARSIVHRDLKPSNIMVTSRGDVRILDWGLVRTRNLEGRGEGGGGGRAEGAGQASARLTLTGALMGTPAYMSPEQAEGATGKIGPATDVYAVGAILYEILTGTPPFTGSLAQVLEKVAEGRIEPPTSRAPAREIPAALEKVTVVAMAKEPEGRYPDAAAFAADLEAWLAGEPVSVVVPPWSERVVRFVHRHRRAVTASVVALVLGTISAYAIRADLASARREEELRAEGVRKAREDRVLVSRGRVERAMKAAREQSASVRDAVRLWREALDREDAALAGVPPLPEMSPEETPEEFARRTEDILGDLPDTAQWQAFERALAIRTDPEVTDPESSRALAEEAHGERGAFHLAREEARAAAKALLRALDDAGLPPDRSGADPLAALELDWLLDLALLEEELGLSPTTLAAGRRTAEFETSREDLASPWREIADLADLADELPAARRARRLLSAKAKVALAPLADGVTGTLYLLTGESLWARETAEGELIEDPLAGMVEVAPLPSQDRALDLEMGEYLVVLAKGDATVRQTFALLRADAERDTPLEIRPEFPDRIPAGTIHVAKSGFVAGGDAYQALPRHRAAVPRSFFIMEREVTIAEYAQFLRATSGPSLGSADSLLVPTFETGRAVVNLFDDSLAIAPGLRDLFTPDHPVSAMSYVAASAYARWKTISDPDGFTWRLPDGLEWEFVARGVAGRIHPWGDSWRPERASTLGTLGDAFSAPAALHQAGRSVHGCFDLAGNVWEWTPAPFSDRHVTVRGGSSGNERNAARGAARSGSHLRSLDSFSGFRLVALPAEAR